MKTLSAGHSQLEADFLLHHPFGKNRFSLLIELAHSLGYTLLARQI